VRIPEHLRPCITFHGTCAADEPLRAVSGQSRHLAFFFWVSHKSLILRLEGGNTLRVLPVSASPAVTATGQEDSAHACQRANAPAWAGHGRVQGAAFSDQKNPGAPAYKSPAPKSRAFPIVRIRDSKKGKQGKSTARTVRKSWAQVSGCKLRAIGGTPIEHIRKYCDKSGNTVVVAGCAVHRGIIDVCFSLGAGLNGKYPTQANGRLAWATEAPTAGVHEARGCVVGWKYAQLFGSEPFSPSSARPPST